MFLFHFEDFRKDNRTVFRKVAKFLEIELTAGQLEKLVEIVDINKMNEKVNVHDDMKDMKKTSFVNTGEVGKKVEGISDEVAAKIRNQKTLVDKVFRKSTVVKL